MKFQSILAIALVALNASSMAEAANPLKRSAVAREIMAAKRRGDSKESLMKLKEQLRDEIRVAKAAGVSHETLRKAQARGATLNDIKAKVNLSNLNKKKKRGIFKKKEVTISSILFPGVSPVDYTQGESMVALVDVVTSQKTQLPIDYYRLPVCEPRETTEKFRGKRKNLGERLAGKSQLKHSPYPFTVKQDHGCKVLCERQFDRKTLKKMRKLIQREYTVNLSLDGLPAHVQKSSGAVIRGYPLGSKLINEVLQKTDFVLHNHLRFTVLYNSDDSSPGSVRIVGYNVHPVSINHDSKNIEATCNANDRVKNAEETLLMIKQLDDKGQTTPITYSYDVQWMEADTVWSDRWDIFLLGNPDDSSAHHMSILNSIMIVVFLASCTIVILVKALRKDLAVYNELGIDAMDDEEESGWKMIHGDVFRPPSTSPMGLSVLVGSGAQIAVSILGTLLLSLTNLLTPSMKGQALGNIVLLYVFSGSIGGYISARIFKLYGGKNWKLNTLCTAAFFPGTIMALFLALNVFLAFYGSAKTVSLFTIILAGILWVCVASPLVFVGSFIGFKRDAIEVPTRTNQIARVVPEQHSLLSSKLASIAAGGLPFSCAVIEIYFLMGAIWLHQYYYLMGYLLTIAVLIGVTSQLISIIMCYLRLAGEDHRWWWKAFTDTASISIWLFGYSLWFLVCRLNLVGFLPVVVYFTYMAMMSLALGLYCGSISFMTVFWFNKRIYSAIKID